MKGEKEGPENCKAVMSTSRKVKNKEERGGKKIIKNKINNNKKIIIKIYNNKMK